MTRRISALTIAATLIAGLLTAAAPAASAAKVTDVAVGFSSTCAVTAKGAVKCWGNSGYGKLGDGSLSPSDTPVQVLKLKKKAVQVVAGYEHVCALKSSGIVLCWGHDGSGQLGRGAFTGEDPNPIPQKVKGLKKVVAIAAGGNQTCAIVGPKRAAKCWGFNNQYQLGTGQAGNRNLPTQVKGLKKDVAQIAINYIRGCALTTKGAVKCWGFNGDAGTGTGVPAVEVKVPTQVTGLKKGVTQISVHDSQNCAITGTGAAKCWGANFSGQLGDGTLAPRSAPTQVKKLKKKVASISAGGALGCAIKGKGALFCWGRNEFGQVGSGSPVPDKVLTPGKVKGLTKAGVVSAGAHHVCAIRNIKNGKGALFCWGRNTDGQLGDGTNDISYVPKKVKGL